MNALDHISHIKHRVIQEKSQARVEITFISDIPHTGCEKVDRLVRLIEVIRV